MKYCRHAVALKGGKKYFDGPITGLSNEFLSDLYGSEIGTALLFGEQEAQKTPARDPARLVLAAA